MLGPVPPIFSVPEITIENTQKKFGKSTTMMGVLTLKNIKKSNKSGMESWLVVSTPLKNMKVNWGMIIPNMHGKKKVMFQVPVTTNQMIYIYINPNKSPFSYGFHGFLWFSYGFPMVFLWILWPPLPLQELMEMLKLQISLGAVSAEEGKIAQQADPADPGDVRAERWPFGNDEA